MKPGLGSILEATLDDLIGSVRTERLFNVLVVNPVLIEDSGSRVSRAKLAQALSMLLFEDLIERVPAARIYVEHGLRNGKTIMHDHGAVRTIAMAGMGSVPAGQESITRILRPLGYALNGCNRLRSESWVTIITLKMGKVTDTTPREYSRGSKESRCVHSYGLPGCQWNSSGWC
jgi:Domain of unknown function (DUF1338)